MLAKFICDIVDESERVQREEEFPLIKPFDLGEKDDQMSAEISLELFDQKEVSGLQSYILDKQRKCFNSNERMDGPGKYKETLAEWNIRCCYPCMRQYLLHVSFDVKRFCHRFQAGVSLPLISPQSIALASERTKAFSFCERK